MNERSLTHLHTHTHTHARIEAKQCTRMKYHGRQEEYTYIMYLCIIKRVNLLIKSETGVDSVVIWSKISSVWSRMWREMTAIANTYPRRSCFNKFPHTSHRTSRPQNGFPDSMSALFCISQAREYLLNAGTMYNILGDGVVRRKIGISTRAYRRHIQHDDDDGSTRLCETATAAADGPRNGRL